MQHKTMQPGTLLNESARFCTFLPGLHIFARFCSSYGRCYPALFIFARLCTCASGMHQKLKFLGTFGYSKLTQLFAYNIIKGKMPAACVGKSDGSRASMTSRLNRGNFGSFVQTNQARKKMKLKYCIV